MMENEVKGEAVPYVGKYNAYIGKRVSVLINALSYGLNEDRNSGSANVSLLVKAKLVGETEDAVVLEDVLFEQSGQGPNRDQDSGIIDKAYVIGIFRKPAKKKK